MVGIYMLSFSDGNLVYIGQSTKISTRYKQHMYELDKGIHTNYKLRSAYTAYGKPELIILEQCDILELDTKEVSWIQEFDSVNSGLNISWGGKADRGLNANGSKHSKCTILKIFSLLYKTTNTQIRISERLGVPKPTIAKLACGNSHLWLKSEYPEKYARMVEMNKLRVSLNHTGGYRRKYPLILGPDGTEYTVTTVKQFCRDHPLLGENDTGIGQVMCGAKKQHKGFRIKPAVNTQF